MSRRLGLLLIALTLTAPVRAVVIADSIAEFSSTQGQDGWFYGLFNAGGIPGSPDPYSTAAFAELDVFNLTRWEASDALVGADNNDFLSLDSVGGHPTGIGPEAQDSVIWAVRRYLSDFAGDAVIDFDLRKLNTGNDRGGGITGRIFIDGVEIFAAFIANDDGIGIQDVLPATLAVGTVIDFAIDSTGVLPVAGGDGPFSARADGSHFSAVIRTAEPASVSLMMLGLLGFLAVRGRRQHRTTFLMNIPRAPFKSLSIR